MALFFIKYDRRNQHSNQPINLSKLRWKTPYEKRISGSVANIYKGQAALICGRNYPANAINCL